MIRGILGLLGLALVACSPDLHLQAEADERSGSAAGVTGASARGSNSGAAGRGRPSAPRAGTSRSATLPRPTVGTPGVLDPVTVGEPLLLDDCGPANPAGLSDADRRALQTGGSGEAPNLLYPYDGTVFPRGLAAPLVMWQGGPVTPVEAVYVRLYTPGFEYRGCLVPSAAGQLKLPQAVWEQAGARTLGKVHPHKLELTLWAAGAASQRASLAFTIAQATVNGSIFYNSYSSKLPGASGGNVLRIPAGGDAEVFLSQSCNGCHSVSANGARMIAQVDLDSGGSFQLEPGSAKDPQMREAGPRASYGALYPDGSKYLATSVAIEVARALVSEGVGAAPDATLYATDTGAVVPNSGIPSGALMPMFSPDGTRLVFNDFAIDAGHGLAIMHYDTAEHAATEYRQLTLDPDGMRPAWPFVLPDNRAVVFVRTDSPDFSGGGAGLLGTPLPGPLSDLQLVDVESGVVTILARAMGYANPTDAANEVTYLPFGPEEVHHNYFPTVAPVAAGGYFWVFFDALRHYGNQGMQRQLWGTALEISPNGTYTQDPSHPAFYLPGQEFGTGNHRAFAALDPCKADGDDCSSGVDCCGGFCNLPDSAAAMNASTAAGSCTSERPICSRRDERCATDADCCPGSAGASNVCIAGFCAFVGLE